MSLFMLLTTKITIGKKGVFSGRLGIHQDQISADRARKLGLAVGYFFFCPVVPDFFGRFPFNHSSHRHHGSVPATNNGVHQFK